MAVVLADTNLWLRSVDPNAAQHAVARRALKELAVSGHKTNLAPQILTEFWAVATRPTGVNGLGWSTDQAWMEARQLWDCFPMLGEPPQTLAVWLQIVKQHEVKGKRTHDAKLAALLEAQQVECLLAFNGSDFAPFSKVTVLEPAEVAAGEFMP